MSEQPNMASSYSNKQPNRKESRQINFRVSDQDYLKLSQSANILNMSVPVFVKKKAQGARIVARTLQELQSEVANIWQQLT